jgi:hypothetical protein
MGEEPVPVLFQVGLEVVIGIADGITRAAVSDL